MEHAVQGDLRNLLWAKTNPFKPLWMHLVETGIVAQELVRTGCFYPLGQELCVYLQLNESKMLALVGYIASMHDIGKAAGPFQAQNESMKKILEQKGIFCDYPGFRHEEYGAECLRKSIWKSTKRFSKMEVRKRFAAVIRYHHQKTFVKRSFRPSIAYHKIEDVWLDVQRQIEECLWNDFGPSDTSPIHMDAVCTLLLGIVIAADWIASGELFAHLDTQRSKKTVIEDARRLIGNFLAENHMLHREFPTGIDRFTKLWKHKHISKENMRPLQSAAEKLLENTEEIPLAVILEAPMGEGKTEAGLYMAARLAQRWGKEGFYVALPTAATSNQMHSRVDEMLRALHLPESKLMHGMAWVMDADRETENPEFYGESAQDALLWTAPMRRGMIAPFAVGTIDQVMMAAMRTKYGVLRLAGLTQKVLIIDELHSYDAYMGSIIKTLLCWCRVLHIPVVMLSATLPLEMKRSFAECYCTAGSVENLTNKSYPSITMFYEDKPTREVPVLGTHQKMTVHVDQQPLLEQPEQIAALVRNRIELHGGCIGVILNTVKEAQETYCMLRKVLRDDCKVVLFHARFSAARRNELEKECTRLLGSDKRNRPERFVLVATQVAEQSLDLDFDDMVSDLCPIDLLLQRVGRLWRHEETLRPSGIGFPHLTVLTPSNSDFSSSGIVYPSILLERTWKVIQERETFQLPEDIPGLVECVYTGYVADEQEMEHWMEYQIANQMEASEAQIQEMPLPGQECFWLEDGIGKNRDMFYSDEDTAFLPAKTRLGELSIRLAILPRDVFDEVKGKECISRSLAKRVLQYSLTVAERKVKFLKENTFHQGEKPLLGKGLLCGVWMLAGEGNVCCFDDGHVIRIDDDMGLLIDDEIGRLIEGEKQ